MDSDTFDAITRLAANVPDRRNMLKAVGAAAVAGAAGVLSRDDAEAATSVVITNLLNNVSLELPLKNKQCGGPICNAVQAVSVLTGAPLDCDIQG